MYVAAEEAGVPDELRGPHAQEANTSAPEPHHDAPPRAGADVQAGATPAQRDAAPEPAQADAVPDVAPAVARRRFAPNGNEAPVVAGGPKRLHLSANGCLLGERGVRQHLPDPVEERRPG